MRRRGFIGVAGSELKAIDHGEQRDSSTVIHEPRVRSACPVAANHNRPGPPAMTSRLWYRAVLRDALVAASQLPRIREHFADLLGAAGWPDGACLFLRTGQGSGKKAREDGRAVAAAVFFSPAAIAAVPHLIAVCDAVPSPPPDRDCLVLLVGRQSDWDLLPRGTH